MNPKSSIVHLHYLMRQIFYNYDPLNDLEKNRPGLLLLKTKVYFYQCSLSVFKNSKHQIFIHWNVTEEKMAWECSLNHCKTAIIFWLHTIGPDETDRIIIHNYFGKIALRKTARHPPWCSFYLDYLLMYIIRDIYWMRFTKRAHSRLYFYPHNAFI